MVDLLDPHYPWKNCYNDTEWVAAKGMYFSREVCKGKLEE